MTSKVSLAVASTLTAGALLLASPATATVMTTNCFSPTACSLDDLDNGGTITVNDKLFTNWGIDEDIFSDISPDFSNIIVSGLEDGGLDPGPGLKYSFNRELILDEDNGDSFYGLLIDYDVVVLNPALRIKDNSLTLTGFNFTGFGGLIEILEDIENSMGDLIGQKEVFADNLFSDFRLTDAATFAPESTITVFKEIFIGTDGIPGTIVTLDMFEQRFSQISEVPEPGALTLFGLGLAGLALVRRRRMI